MYLIQFNSIQFHAYLLVCRLESVAAFYKASTKTQDTKTVEMYKIRTLNKNIYSKRAIQKVLGKSSKR